MTTYLGVKSRDTALLAQGAEDFDFTDQKGRKIGYKWTLTEVQVTLMTAAEYAAAKSCYTTTPDAPLHYFAVWGTPTRDGHGYGPAFNTTRVGTQDEGYKLVAKRIANARKANMKKFVK